jgi:hypothetical protein
LLTRAPAPAIVNLEGIVNVVPDRTSKVEVPTARLTVLVLASVIDEEETNFEPAARSILSVGVAAMNPNVLSVVLESRTSVPELTIEPENVVEFLERIKEDDTTVIRVFEMPDISPVCFHVPGPEKIFEFDDPVTSSEPDEVTVSPGVI